ncbi:prostaglandin F2-alpha receptor-like [Saccoglossus kowalevskii]
MTTVEGPVSTVSVATALGPPTPNDDEDCPGLIVPDNIRYIGMPFTHNETDKEPVPLFAHVSAVVPTTVVTTALFVSICALIVFYRMDRRTRNPAFYRMLGALLWTDLFSVLAVGILPVVIAFIDEQLLLHVEMLCDYHGFAVIAHWYEAALILALMATERYIATRHPDIYLVKMESGKVKWMIGISLILAMFLACMPVVGFGKNVIHYPGNWCFINWLSRDTSQRLYASLFIAVIAGIVIGVTGCVTSVGITMKIKQRGRRNSVVELKHNINSSQSGAAHEVEMLILLTSFTCVFIACWTPLVAKVLVNTLEKTVSRDSSVELIAFLVSLSRLIVNPTVFIVSRMQLLRHICCSKKDESPQISSTEPVDRSYDPSGNIVPIESCCEICCGPTWWLRDNEADSRFSYFSTGRTVYGSEFSGVSCHAENISTENSTEMKAVVDLANRDVLLPGCTPSPLLPNRMASHDHRRESVA